MRIGLAIVALLAAGCGRVGFDQRSGLNTGDGRDGDGGNLGDALGDVPFVGDLVVWFDFVEGIDLQVTDRVSGLSGLCFGGCPQPTPSPVGVQGSGYDFDGTDECVRIADHPVLHQSQVTLSVWVRHDETTRNDTIVAKRWGSGDANSWQLETGAGAPIPVNGAGFSTTHSMTNLNTVLGTAGGELTIAAWHHVAATFDGTAKRLYVDGVERAAAMLVPPLDYDAGGMTIGCDENAAANQQFFSGGIDEVKIFRRALDASEIATLATP